MSNTPVQNPKPAKQTNPTCPTPQPPPVQTCCELVCFERPNYFCGHLLTDADLSKDQWYFREKNKLYHRTLHGHGIVCGLRLTCEPDCCGGISVDKGYAIDDCGNDLVVCEPITVDVIGILRDKGYLVESPPVDPCKPKEHRAECKVRQCFYVAACYQEELSDFTTPLVTSCLPNLTGCEPTRIQEGVRIDILADLPTEESWLDELKSRLEGCFCLFSEGPFARALKAHAKELEDIIGGGPEIEPADVYRHHRHRGYCELFCELRGLLLLYLKKHPDRYNCTLEAEILKIHCPHHECEDFQEKIREVFCRLLELIWQYVISCVLGEFVPPCPEPSKGSCVVLGTVEVEDGCVVRVCNCPRSYVWSFSNFFEVILATLIGESACENQVRYHEGEEHCGKPVKEHPCCREFDLDCNWLIKLLNINSKSFYYNAVAGLDAVAMAKKSLRDAFDFTQAGSYSTRIFEYMDLEKAEAVTRLLKVAAYRAEDQPPVTPIPNPSQTLRMMGLSTREDPLVLFQKEGRVTSAFIDPQPAVALDPKDRARFEERFTRAEAAAKKAAEQAKFLEAELQSRKKEVADLQGRLETVTRKATDMTEQIAKIEPRLKAADEAQKEFIKMQKTLADLKSVVDKLPKQSK
jgi:hypothetical protein